MRRLVIVTGLSGAGKSQAMKSFEDFDFACLDHVPPVLAKPFVDLVSRTGRERAAIALDVRTGGAFGEALPAIDELAGTGVVTEILFLDATDETLVRRYSETRRRHPYAACSGNLVEAIAAERASLATLRDRADHVWDTTRLTHGMLKERIAATFGDDTDARVRVGIVAFGFKYGLPIDADIVFDVRFLPNPNYIAELKPLTGNDPPVAAYLDALPDLHLFEAKLFDVIDFCLPRFRSEGKSHVVIAIGCTGGRHRSVYLAHRLERHLLATSDVRLRVEERDIAR